ncbi:DUF7310 family coiled-coil domain-containing protein [Halorubrum salsamenti]|uniref:DUF7310 family coiled-coil domain-containing protein n=1 Tax=Halorubrum salsamenti TaxID=2583990 RepID=UPI001F4F4061|nr:hypothetical protein [Halorubrum salsamenti]
MTDRAMEDRPSRRDGAETGARSERTGLDQTSLAGKSQRRTGDSGGGPCADVNTESSTDPNPEPGDDRVEARLRAVERAITESDDAVADIGDEAAASAEREELATRLDNLEARIEELEAATQAIRGYVGSIRAVNQAVERRADLALAKAGEDGDATAGDSPITDSRAAADEDVTPDCDGIDDAVPSEAALDAAVPSERYRGDGTGSPAESAVDRAETDGEEVDDSWRSGALDRLRESL